MLLPDLHKSQLMRMFREALQRSVADNPNALTADSFSNAVLRAQGFAARHH